MKKNFFDTDLWKWIKLIAEILIIIAVVWLFVWAFNHFSLSEAFAEDCEVRYVVCQPWDIVNIRPRPNKRGEPEGFLEPGDMVQVDGKAKNGYVHCINLTTESGEGWVSKGYLLKDKPELLNCTATVVSKGRLAARKNVGGKRTRWLQPMATVKVYYWTDEWAVTNCGYVQSKFLEVDGSND